MPPTRVAPIWDGQRQLVEDAVGEEADVDAVQGGGEPVDHAGQPGDDLGEVVQAAAAAQLFGVVHDGLEAQHVLAFGVGLQRQSPKWILNKVRSY